MALSVVERREIDAFILNFHENEFAPVLSRYYALGVAYANKHPTNINNELRNAITHMSRALCMDDIVTARIELKSAARHVERFKRDCLKMAVIYAGRDVSKIIRHAHVTYNRFDPNISLEVAGLVGRKYKILMDEVLGDEDAASKWEDLLLDIEKLREKTLQSYVLLDAKKYWFPLFLLHLWRVFKWVCVAVGLAIATAAIWAVMVPDQENFGKKGQQFIGRVLLGIESPAASTPSTGVTPGGEQQPGQ